MDAGKKFQFLTMEEFNLLSRRDKTRYLEQAAAKIAEMKGAPGEQSLFKDGPPLPGIGPDSLPKNKKPA